MADSGIWSRSLYSMPLARRAAAVRSGRSRWRIFVEKKGFPPSLLNEIKRLAAFHHPEFYTKRAMRLSTAPTPRVIGGAEELSRYVALPRGCRDSLAELASDVDFELRIDDVRLDTLFLTMPISWKGARVQYAGRLHRIHAGKTDVQIIDYVDSKVPMLARMFEKRLRGYTAMGYQRRAGSFTQQSPLAVSDEGVKKMAMVDRDLL